MSNFEENSESIRVLNDPKQILETYLTLIRSAKSEILIIFPTINAVRREQKIGVIDELINSRIRDVKIRVLTPEDEFITDILEKPKKSGVLFQIIENPSETKFKIIIIDKKFALNVETKDDVKSEFIEAVGSATLSNKKESIFPFISIFESFWREAELLHKIKVADAIKDDFINIASHELRNPLLPIIASIEELQDDIKELTKSSINREYMISNMNIILRNSMRLLQISEDLLQISKIDSGTFKLNVSGFDLNSTIIEVIADIKKKYIGERPEVQYIYESKLRKQGDGNFTVYYDKSKIQQAIFNLLDNASKFTLKGDIVISTKHQNNELNLEVKDYGSGIDESIMVHLFEKFVSKSEKGIGLGLYITKKIIEAHGGKIWASNNLKESGATFFLSLPTNWIITP